MLKRLDILQLHEWVPHLVFAFTAGVFIFIFIRSIRMKKARADHMAALPLDDGGVDQTPPADREASGD